ncbi:MAG: response regulator [Thermodesulfobacteriota bacterium]
MSPAPIRVLVVDDDEFVRLNLAAYLEDEGFAAVASTSGEEALHLLAREPMDVAVVDMRLPGLDGNAFILEAHRLQPRIRFLIHTGSIGYTIPEEVRSIGVRPEHVFLKPLADMSLLRAAVEALVRETRGLNQDVSTLTGAKERGRP